MINIDDKLINAFSKLPYDFWDFKGSDTKELTHGLHSYPATMIYPISRNILDIVTTFSNVNSLLDPFMGSGTVLVEGLIKGITSIYGNDLNPLAYLMSKVKTTPLNVDTLSNSISSLLLNIKKDYKNYSIFFKNLYPEIEKLNIDITASIYDKQNWGNNSYQILNDLLNKYNLNLNIPNFKNIGFWFVPNAIVELQIIKNNILNIENIDIKNFILLAFSETVRLVSNRRNGEFKMYRMQSDKVKNYRPNVFDTFEKILIRNTEKMNSFTNIISKNSTQTVSLSNDDARVLDSIPDNSIDLIITSPPYGDSRTTVSYGEFSKVSLQWLNLDNTNDEIIKNIDKSLMGGTKFNKRF